MPAFRRAFVSLRSEFKRENHNRHIVHNNRMVWSHDSISYVQCAHLKQDDDGAT